MKSVLFLVSLFLLIASGLYAVPSRVDLYFMDWDILTRSAQTPDDVRRHSVKSLVINRPDEISEILVLLALEDLKLRSDKETLLEDARLTVDLTEADGRISTYYASRFRLCASDGFLKRDIDQSFRDKIAAKLVGTKRLTPSSNGPTRQLHMTIVNDQPNQALVPMTLRVMPSAFAEATPRKVMAHLERQAVLRVGASYNRVKIEAMVSTNRLANLQSGLKWVFEGHHIGGLSHA